ncbi:hypothetical protein FYK55_03675 [Roseiconus nitratireducens]|uniref:Uncharacterized protein n=1 Tax=Roseiconus nitratireducens TaxID=2605748 RepID=A0A5M6DER1_9BACT|nr:hypothetical protein [Roseiconus nitratireducens]KAA5546017.1 hypothetical protein FYK55_03675 [Roseiconus nitratireducens]
MAPISERTRASLDRLNEQIGAAEKVLKTLPGSRHPACEIDVTEELRECDVSDRRCRGYMRYGSYEGFLGLHIAHVDSKNMLLSCDAIDDRVAFPITVRIALARRIPELIVIANQSENEVAAAAEEAAAEIEHAIASLTAYDA